MKTKALRIIALIVAGCAALSSCMTTYDANGRPVQSVDPGTAAAGAVAAGVLGYALADNRSHRTYYADPYYGRPYYGRPYYRGRPHSRNVYYREGTPSRYRTGVERQKSRDGYVEGSRPSRDRD